jgi:hypothetical protein
MNGHGTVFCCFFFSIFGGKKTFRTHCTIAVAMQMPGPLSDNVGVYAFLTRETEKRGSKKDGKWRGRERERKRVGGEREREREGGRESFPS